MVEQAPLKRARRRLSQTSVQSLPPEILGLAGSYLALADVPAVRRVSRAFNDPVNGPVQGLFQRVLQRDFPEGKDSYAELYETRSRLIRQEIPRMVEKILSKLLDDWTHERDPVRVFYIYVYVSPPDAREQKLVFKVLNEWHAEEDRYAADLGVNLLIYDRPLLQAVTTGPVYTNFFYDHHLVELYDENYASDTSVVDMPVDLDLAHLDDPEDRDVRTFLHERMYLLLTATSQIHPGQRIVVIVDSEEPGGGAIIESEKLGEISPSISLTS